MDVLSIALGVSTALGAGGTLAYWYETRSSGARTRRIQEIDNRITEAVAPLTRDVSVVRAKVEHLSEHQQALLRAAISETLEPLRSELVAVQTKIDPLWKALEQVAINNATVLHHPHPRRAAFDTLLDHFQHGTLGPDEERQLRRYLRKVKDYEPGQDLGFPMYDGEASAAANLLALLDLVNTYRLLSQAEHKSYANQTG